VATAAAVSAAAVGERRSCRATTKIRFRTSQTLAGIVRGGGGGGGGSARPVIIILYANTRTHTPTHTIYIYTYRTS